MTQNRHHAAPMRTSNRWTKTDRILSAGLATATCIGIVGVMGVRAVESSAASQQDVAAQAGDASLAVSSVPVSSAGLTQAQLDAYAAQLQQQGAQLDAYQASLAAVAKQLRSGSASASVPAVATVKKPKPVVKAAPKPVAKPAPKPAPKPQSNTKSS